MVSPDDFKQRIEQIISQKYKIEFLGKNFEQIANLMTASKADDIYRWLAEVVSKEVQPIMVGSKKPYKEWTINQLLVFRYPFIINNTEYRILFVKVKNSKLYPLQQRP